MIIVSNTSPITNLAAIGRLDLLRSEFLQIQIADAVWDELNAENTQWPGAREVSDAPWITRSTSGNHALINVLRRHLVRETAPPRAPELQRRPASRHLTPTTGEMGERERYAGANVDTRRDLVELVTRRLLGGL